MIFGEPDSLREPYGAHEPRVSSRTLQLGADNSVFRRCVLLLGSLASCVPLASWFHVPKAYYPLAAAIALLAIIAVSPWVRIGTSIFDLSFLLPEAIIELYAVHRATVRLAWPLVMCLSLLGLAHFIIKWPRGRAVLVLGVAFVLQIYSAWPYWDYEFRYARAAGWPPSDTRAGLGGASLRYPFLESGSFFVTRPSTNPSGL